MIKKMTAYNRMLIANIPEDLDNAVDNSLACHLSDPGSNPGQGMWQGSGRRSRFGAFPRVLRFPPSRFDHITPTSVPSRGRLVS